MERVKRIKRAKQDFDYWHSLHKEGLTISEISQKLDIPYNTIYYGFKRLELPIFKTQKTISHYETNHSYFNKIDNQNKAYFLGLIIADGFITAGNKICLKLSLDDKKLVSKFRDIISPNRPIHIEDPGEKVICGRTCNFNGSCKVEMSSNSMVKALDKLGVIPDKTGKEVLPDIEDKFYRHVIRGIFDGDGSISIRKSRPNQRNINICSSSNSFLQEIKDKLEESDIHGQIYVETRGKYKDMYRLMFTTHKDRCKLFNYLYKDAEIKLNRKFKMFENYVNTVLTNTSGVSSVEHRQ